MNLPLLPLLGLSGNTAGYSTYLAINPDAGAGVVVLANTGGFEHADAVGRRLLDPQRSLEPAPRTWTPAKHPD